MIQDSAPQEEPLDPITFGSTVTILFSDIRGFTEYTDQYGDEAAYRMLQHHNSLLQEQIELYGGHIVKTLGDSFMVSFGSARTAVNCAVAVQRTMEQYNRAQQGPKIEVGIGVDTGEPIREADDFFGGTVNRASRICAASGPGRILISEAVRHVVGRMQGADYLDRGFFEIKGFEEPQRLFEIDWSGVGAVRATRVVPPRAGRPEEEAPPPVEPVQPSRKPWLIRVAAATLLILALVGGLSVLVFRSPASAPS